jgi:hypothetical protein
VLEAFRAASAKDMATTRITVETESVTIVRRARVSSGWCPHCRADVAALSTPQAPWTESDGARTAQWVEVVGVHQWRDADGVLFLCIRSLTQRFGADVLNGLVAVPPGEGNPEQGNGR